AGRKLAVAGAAALVATFSLWQGGYRVTADAVMRGEVERSVSAPFDGFLREAPARAGDLVAEGELIAALDDRDLALERLERLGEKRRAELEYGRAIGEGAPAEAEIFRNRVAQAEAQIALADAQIARARLVSPFDGVVVSGDQSQNIGGAVRRGDVLFEIAPRGRYRVDLSVPERAIGDVAVGRRGALVTTSLPDRSFAVVVERITPVAEAAEGGAVFRVEARLDEDAGPLRPGMRGVVKIDVDRRLMIEIWTRALVDWVRLTLWSWFG
ncbi:MAG: HlyD family efflux transporter periplasmic adaptor subunit, partial [Pseudomonadota bacterium]